MPTGRQLKTTESEGCTSETSADEDSQAKQRISKLLKSYQNDALKKFIISFGHETTIDLSEMNLVDRDMKIIVERVLGKNRCRVLNLWFNRFTHQSLSILTDALEQNRTLQELDLSHNPLSAEGARILSTCLSLNTCVLQELDLSSCEINDQGATYIGKMLQKNQKLRTLVLNDNNIGNDGLNNIVQALPKCNKILKYLKLESNRDITPQGVKRILKLLTNEDSLKEIYLKGCSIVGEEITRELQHDAAKVGIWIFL